MALIASMCDACLSALKWFVYHARLYTSARLYLYFSQSYLLCGCVNRSYVVFPAVNAKAETLCVVRCHHVENGSTVLERILFCTASALQLENWSER